MDLVGFRVHDPKRTDFFGGQPESGRFGLRRSLLTIRAQLPVAFDRKRSFQHRRNCASDLDLSHDCGTCYTVSNEPEGVHRNERGQLSHRATDT